MTQQLLSWFNFIENFFGGQIVPFPMFVIDSGIPIKKFYFVYSVPIGNALRKLPKYSDMANDI